VAAFKQLRLLAGAHAAARVFPVAGIQPIYHVHAVYHFAERREAVLVLPRAIAHHNVYLRGARIRTGHRVSDIAANVALLHRVVLEALAAPRGRDTRFAWDAELGEISGDHAKK